jgi:hypothetical protein
MSVACISSIYGAYDSPFIQPPQTVEAEWILVTDRWTDVPGWRVVVEPRPHTHPRLAAKVAKCLPWNYTDADTVVWLDGACRLLRENSLEQILIASGEHPLSQVVHPWRDCIYDEADASRGMLKYQQQPVDAQVEHYRSEGHPEHWGLWATGLIVRADGRHNGMSKALNMDFGRRWLAEQTRWSYQDQLSEAPLLARSALKVNNLPFPLHGSGLFEWLPHVSEE